jgi:SPW repeat
MNEWSNARLCDVANLILGLFLLVSPWVVGYSGQPMQNAMISGVVIAGLSIAALAAFAQWEEWLNLLLGLWVLASPWLLGFQGTTAALVHIVVGILVAALAAIEIWLTQRTTPAR